MKNLPTLGIGCALILLAAVLLVLPQFAATQTAQSSQSSQSSPPPSAEPVPAYHAQPPTGDLPATLEPAIYSDKLIFNAYTVAGRVKKVLYQEPCYCHCDRSNGHTSLLDCFAGTHGAGCETCIKEAFYSYEQTRRGRTPAQIRDGIIKGEWEKVQLAKYQQNYLPPTNAPSK
jgi:hypothetical protein